MMINFGSVKAALKQLRETVFNNKDRLDKLVLTDNNYTNEDKAKVQTIGVTPDTYYANGADYAEVAEWEDKNPNKEDRLYRFVTVKANGRKIAIADSNDQIAGVTTTKAAFVGNAADYKQDDPTKNIVGILGVVPVKTNDPTIKANDRVMSDDDGYAIKSSNNLGYRVLEVLSDNLVEIAVSVNTDMIQRIKTDMDKKQDKLTAGANITIEDNVISATGGGTGGTSDYNDLENKPQINGHTLSGNKTLNDLGIQPKGNYLTNETDPVFKASPVSKITSSDIASWNNKAEKSEIPDVSGFINKTVNDLVNYYKKSETYTQEEVNNLIGAIPKFGIEVVDELPTSNISPTTVYLLTTGQEESNLYTEYIYVNNTLEKLGEQKVDLTGYATETWVGNQIKDFLNETQVNQLIITALNNYYVKSEIDSKLSAKADKSDIPIVPTN